MIQVLENPTLLDFIKVVLRMPENERENFEALTGQKYDVDSIAMGNFMVQGPKWGVYADGEPISVGGFVFQRTGVWRDFMINTPEAWAKHWFPVTRICKRAMDAMFASKQAHRVDCISLASRTNVEWHKVLGYNLEATLYGYCANGADALLFSRVKHI
jgi:hypothetical protein